MSDQGPIENAATLPPTQGPGIADQPQPQDPWLGREIDGRYRILQRLGEGGMGAVFIAEHLKLHKQVALKTIHASFAGHAEVAARFAREAMASARVEHPHVVSALDYGMLDDGAYLVMPLVRGQSLRDYLDDQGAVPWRRACHIVEQIADAVGAAHAAGIVHRDLKPENVVLEPDDGSDVPNVRVLDFGIAHLRSDSANAQSLGGSAPLTQLGAVIGTPGYMAPEQSVGQAVDERTDLYAIGVMLWEMIAGRQPFVGDSLAELVQQQYAERPPELPTDAQSEAASPELAQLVEQLLNKEPAQRPQEAFGVRDTLRELRRSTSSPMPLAAVLPAASGLKRRLGDLPLGARVAVAALVFLLLLWTLGGDESEANAEQPSPRADESAQHEGRQQRRASGERQQRRQARAEDTEQADEEQGEGGEDEGSNREGRRGGRRLRRAVNSLFR